MSKTGYHPLGYNIQCKLKTLPQWLDEWHPNTTDGHVVGLLTSKFLRRLAESLSANNRNENLTGHLIYSYNAEKVEKENKQKVNQERENTSFNK